MSFGPTDLPRLSGACRAADYSPIPCVCAGLVRVVVLPSSLQSPVLLVPVRSQMQLPSPLWFGGASETGARPPSTTVQFNFRAHAERGQKRRFHGDCAVARD